MPNLTSDTGSSHANAQSNLLANSMDFLVSAAEYASRDDEGSWKDGRERIR